MKGFWKRNKSGIIATIAIVGAVVLFFILARTVGTVVSVSGDSMYPTMEDGDLVLCSVVKDADSLEIGDIVVFKNDDKLLIKRILLTEGMTYKQENTSVFVGNNEFFVVGDNTDNSRDSRDFGPISTKDVVYKSQVVIPSSFFWMTLVLLLAIFSVFYLPQVLFLGCNKDSDSDE